MALTKVTKSGITDNAIDADKLEDGTIVAADIAPGTITDAKLSSTLDLSSKTVTLPNTSVTNAMLAGSIANAKLANSSITINGTSVSLGGSITGIGKVSWQSVVTADGSTATSATAGYGYFIDTTSAAHTLTLPGSPSAGDTIAIKDYAATFGTNALTIGRNGNNIQGIANDSLINTNRASVVLVYIDATKGWLYTNESNVADLGFTSYITATGGTVTTSGNYKIHTFTGDGCFAVSVAGAGAGPSVVDYLVIAGGGGGGRDDGGGGGAGGYRESHSTPVSGCYTASPVATSTGITVTATTYPVTVGAGGAGGVLSPGAANSGQPGSNSVFSTITSTAGGGGARGSCNPWGSNSGGPGGSGGGGTRDNGTPYCGGTGNTPPTSPSQGNPGGTAAPAPNGGGGGGGIGSAGSNATASTYGIGGPGGNGVTSSINGTPTTRAGGGGGGGNCGVGSGGPGGGGSAGPTGTAGTANTGGGGGGGRTNPGARCGGAGGKGIVIIRYKYQ